MEDQITYPLTTSLLGVPGVRTVRSFSMMGFSTIYVVFEEDVEFYWSRSRILEKLNSLPSGLLPNDVTPALGPDATALGQVFWYTLEGRDGDGNPTGGWDLDELRTVQDFHVRYALMAADGVAEVASVGGFRREFQVEVDPDSMRAHGVELSQVMRAVRSSNQEVGARTIEVNAVEYLVRGLGWVEDTSDLEEAVVRVTQDGIPVRLQDVATIQLGPALRRGALDKGGNEAVGGVVVSRFGANPMATIQAVKETIKEIENGLPRKTLKDGRVSKLHIIPFYDRSELINETLDTLKRALSEEILVTILVVVFMLANLRSSFMLSLVLPLAVLCAFLGMKWTGVEANVVALAGIAIAIGTMVDMGIVLVENIQKRLEEAPEGENSIQTIASAATEVGSAVMTAVATTVIGFLPVFTMTGAEGRLFKPLAFTKTYALLGSLFISLLLVPVLAFLFHRWKPSRKQKNDGRRGPLSWAILIFSGLLLAEHWQPLGPTAGLLTNSIFVFCTSFGLLWGFELFHKRYESILRWCLSNKLLFLVSPTIVLAAGGWVWKNSGQEFMPQLDEGSFLYMPTTMPHAGMGESLDALSKMDQSIESIPEVTQVIGKIGRVESALDPAPLSMVESVIHYKPEFGTDSDGNRIRQWREHIRTKEDIWKEIQKAAEVPGSTSAPLLQPISTRIVMLQSGMRAPMGVKVKAPNLISLERAALDIEASLREAEGVEANTVAADRVVGKPYLEVSVDREAAARFGLNVADIHQSLAIAVGGKSLGTTAQGRERYPITLRYARETRDSLEAIQDLHILAPTGAHVTLEQVANVDYVRGPQVLKTEDTFLTAYVVFDKHPGWSEVKAVEAAREHLLQAQSKGELLLPSGVSYVFDGSWKNQVHAQRTLSIVLPLALLLILMVLHLQFRSVSTSAIVFSGVIVAWAGGFILLGLYSQPWFLDIQLFGQSLREVFAVHPINLSIAVWVGFLALFGIATDDGVVMATYLRQTFNQEKPGTVQGVREAVVHAGLRRVRPCLMTSATTLLALLPVLSSTGKGAEVMIPMAIPSFGGMAIALMSMFLVPVLWSWRAERKLLS
jgi:Cu(I)/Ag(I) efflux system membrane protein CusA/SilA